jgi:hypothetical protein
MRSVPLSLSAAALLAALSCTASTEETEAPVAAEVLPTDPTVWPNAWSRANSDPWIVEHHDEIRQMRPRLLVINFSNQMPAERVRPMTEELIAALRESSRYHGYANPDAPPFLEYSIFKIIDLRDEGSDKGNSTKSPMKPGVERRINCDYDAFFNDTFAELYNVRDPDNASRYLPLGELLDGGFVHEVWFFACADGVFRCLECVELKPVYDEAFVRQGTEYRQAGNGGDRDQRWTGRSVRINCINHERGIGCAMENLGHAMEGMAHSKCIPYYRKYFYEYAGFDLDTRWGLPFRSFYPLWGEGKGIEYPDERTAIPFTPDERHTVEDYYAIGGNVHFPPNGRHHYDMDNDQPVLSTIEGWREGGGPDGADRKMPWTNEAFARYRDLAPDCMGAWLVYWRQNMPGLDNGKTDDEGRPMKNWLPFLFY